MSRIGKKPISIPKGVDIKIQNRDMTVKGPKGELKWTFPEKVKVNVEGEQALVTRENDTKQTRAYHGLVRSLLQNMVTGVSQGFTRVLEITGVGYRAQVQGNKIVFALGYSHPVEFQLPDGVSAEVDKKQVVLTLGSIDNQLLGQVAADIKALRPPDSYKGKGIRYSGEHIKLKAGKAAK